MPPGGASRGGGRGVLGHWVRRGLVAVVMAAVAGCTYEGSAPSAAPAALNRPGTAVTGPAVTRLRSTTAGTSRSRLVREVIRFGTSGRGVPLVAVHVGDPTRPPVLIVGCIHGDECAGLAVSTRLAALTPTGAAGANLWIVADLNPDGYARGTRTDGRGVDLNRNFPHAWRPGARGSRYPGPAAASEPEAASMVALLRRIHPAVGIWFHQALALIDNSEGPPRAEAAVARALGLPERSLPDFPGSAIGYENSLMPRSGFAVELRPGRLDSAATTRVIRAILTLVR